MKDCSRAAHRPTAIITFAVLHARQILVCDIGTIYDVAYSRTVDGYLSSVDALATDAALYSIFVLIPAVGDYDCVLWSGAAGYPSLQDDLK